eukprot:2882446-Rhodomonas_salina.2
MLKWIPPKHHNTLTEYYGSHNHDSIFIASHKPLPPDTIDTLEWHFESKALYPDNPVTYHQDWWPWLMGNKALSTSTPPTSLLVCSHSSHPGSPPIPLSPPTNPTHRLYFSVSY